MLAASAAVTFGTTSPAGAFSGLPGPTTLIPTGLVGGVAGTSSVGAVIGTGLVAPIDVALTGLAAGYAIGTVGRAAVTWGWHWASQDAAGNNQNPGYADPVVGPATFAFQSLGGDGYSYGFDSLSSFVAGTEPGPALQRYISWTSQVQWGSYGADWGADFYCGSVFISAVNQSNDRGTAGHKYSYPTQPVNCLDPVHADFFSYDRPLPDGSTPKSLVGTFSEGATAGGAPGTTPLTTRPRSKCSDGSTVYAPAITYTGSTLSKDLPPITYPACPAGTTPTIRDTPTTGAGGATVPSPIPTWTAPVVPDAFASCQPFGTCALTLTKHSPAGSGQQASLVCNNTTACSGWETLPRTGPARVVKIMTPEGPLHVGDPVTENEPATDDGDWYGCDWGPYALRVTECLTVPTYAPAPTTTPDPGTGTGPGGEPVPTFPPAPLPLPPGTPVPVPGPLPNPDPVPVPTGSNCDGSGLSFNPVTWVVVPLKCLFIPVTLPAQVTNMRSSLGRKPPGSVIAWASGVVPGFGTGWGNASNCAAMPDFDPEQQGRLRLPCQPSNPLFHVGMLCIEAFIYGCTAVKLWGMASAAMGSKGMQVAE